MVFLFLLKSMPKLHWQHKLLLLGIKNTAPDCAFVDFRVNLH